MHWLDVYAEDILGGIAVLQVERWVGCRFLLVLRHQLQPLIRYAGLILDNRENARHRSGGS